MYPTFFELPLLGWIFPFYIPGAVLTLGIGVCVWLCARQARREHEPPAVIVNLLVFELLAGILGARIIYALTKPAYYLNHPLEVLMIWRPGLVWYGGFIGAAFALLYYTRFRKLPFYKYADILVPYMALGHAFGRLSCLLSGCCYGKPTQVAWGIVFPADSNAARSHLEDGLTRQGMPSLPVHPTQLYEAGCNFFFFLFLLWLRRNKTYHGQVEVAWCLGYPLIRFVIESFRGDKIRGVYFLSTSQYLSIGVFVFGVLLYQRLRQQRLASAKAGASAGAY